MYEFIVKAAEGQGFAYSLFVFLLVYVLKTNDSREKRYQGIIDKLTEKFNIVEEVQKDVKDIKQELRR